MDGEILIEKNEDGVLRTDISGLMYMLKNKRISSDTVVVAVMGESLEEGDYISTYIVKESVTGANTLVCLMDEDELDIDTSDFPFDTDSPFDSGDFLEETIGFSIEYDEESFGESMFLELDELMMDCTYFIYPTKPTSKHYDIIHYEEALHRLRNGESVYIDYGKEEAFRKIDSSELLTPDMVIEGIWATSPDVKGLKEESKKKNIDPFSNTHETLGERLEEFLKKDFQNSPNAPSKKKQREIIHDLTIDEFLNKLRDILRDT